VYIGKRKKVFNGGHHVKMQIRIVEMEPKRGLNEVELERGERGLWEEKWKKQICPSPRYFQGIFTKKLSLFLKQAHPVRCWDVIDGELQRV
jgi:hypothetical protein